MIRLYRDRAAVPAPFTGAGRVRRELRLLEARRAVLSHQAEKIDFKSSYWKSAKEQLRAETHGKCAYCEAPTSATYYGDVEHFRPKSEYWWLAYCYDNYLYSCARCNQEYKLAEFPRRGPRLPQPRVQRNSTDARFRELAGTLAPELRDARAAGAPFARMARYFVDVEWRLDVAPAG